MSASFAPPSSLTGGPYGRLGREVSVSQRNNLACAPQHLRLSTAQSVGYRFKSVGGSCNDNRCWPLEPSRDRAMMDGCDFWWPSPGDPRIARVRRLGQPARKYAHTQRPTTSQNAPDTRIARRNVRGHVQFGSRSWRGRTGAVTSYPSISTGRSSGVAAGCDQRGRWIVMV